MKREKDGKIYLNGMLWEIGICKCDNEGHSLLNGLCLNCRQKERSVNNGKAAK